MTLQASIEPLGLALLVSMNHSSAGHDTPDSKVHGANMGPIWGRQDPGGPHVGPMNFAIWDGTQTLSTWILPHVVLMHITVPGHQQAQ